jgi:hypothetical protein
MRDSLNRADKAKTSLSASVFFSFKNKRKSRINLGFQYLNMGFNRYLPDLHFLDTIHPKVGIVADKGETGQKTTYYNTRYIYLAVRGEVARLIYKNGDLESYFTFAAGVGIRLLHEELVTLKGYSAYGKNRFHVKETGYDPAGLNFFFAPGFQFNVQVAENTQLTLKPQFIMPLLPANYSSQRHHLFAAAMEIGFLFNLIPEKKQE